MDFHVAQNMYDSVDTSLQGILGTGTAKVMLGLGSLIGTFWLLNFSLRSVFWIYKGMTTAFREIIIEIAKVA